MTIITLCGFSGSGKDTVADILVSEYGFKKLSFAGVLKDVIAIMFSLDRKMLEGGTPEDREKREIVDEYWSKELDMPGLTPRKLLQVIATEVFRNNFHKEIWVKIVKRQLSLYENVVISDCRFSNELDMIKSQGGILLFIDRNKPLWFDSYKRGEECEEASKLHISETGWIREQFDCTINNNGTLEDLTTNISVFMNMIVI